MAEKKEKEKRREEKDGNTGLKELKDNYVEIMFFVGLSIIRGMRLAKNRGAIISHATWPEALSAFQCNVRYTP